jgi:hypothetical protein
MAVASTPGSHAASLSHGAAEHIAASHVLAKLSAQDTISSGRGADTIRAAGSATLHGGSWGQGTESVASGSGAATLVGAVGANPVAGGLGGTSGHGAFSFDTVQVGGAQLIGNFVSGDHSISGGYNINADRPQAPVAGGQTKISLDDGKTIIHIKGTHHS